MKRIHTGHVLVGLALLGLGVAIGHDIKDALASRNSSGTMSAINGPYVAGTVISAATINARFADIETELTDSASRSGKGGFTAPVRGANGTSTAPTYSFTSETTAGLYRAGAADLRLAFNGTDVGKWTSSGAIFPAGIAADTTINSGFHLGIGGAPTAPLTVTQSGTAAGNAATFFEASLANGNSLALRLGKADSGSSDGLGIYYSANATAANSKGCLAVSGQTDTLCVDGNNKVLMGGAGVGADGAAFKHKRFGATCTTGIGVGQNCTTAYTWTTAFADANYTVSCTCDGQSSGVPVNAGILSKVAAGFSFVIMDASGVNAAQCTAVDCIAVHD